MKKLWGEKEVEAVLHRLDRLTQDEARTTAAQALEVVYGLVQHMRMIMDGEATLFDSESLIIEHPAFSRRQGISRRYPESSRYFCLARIWYRYI